LIVVDASVVVKWFVPEPGEAAAGAMLKESRELLAPALARIEVAAALIKKAQRNELPREACTTALQLWRRMLGADRLILVPDELDLPTACTLALDLGHPLPDCLYLAVALRLDAPLVTADQRFVRRVGERFPGIQLLAPHP
jgi:predicted nucleic acid-binding protein